MNETEHLLTILAEECAEIQVRISKALRFGLNEIEPGQALNNAARISEEIADADAVKQMLYERGILRLPGSQLHQEQLRGKRQKVEKFMAYAVKCGTLQPDHESSGS